MGKYLTTEEYAKSGHKGKKVTQQAIRKAIKYGRLHLLPGVIKVHKAGKYWILEVGE